MKIFPIKVEKAVPTDQKFIEWKIHNVCNHDCSFCGARHKDGSQRWFSLEKYKEYTDKLVEACGDSPFWIQITGGEPTLFPDLLPLLAYMKSKGAMVSLISNGSRTIRWWKELQEAHIIDYLFITYHSEQTDNYTHISEILNLFHNEPIEVVCLVTHSINSLDKAFEARDYLMNNTGAIVTLKSMVFGDFDIYELYSKEQITKLKQNNWVYGNLRNTKKLSTLPIKYKINHALKVTYNKDNLSLTVDPQLLMKKKQNKFLGWECAIGNHNMRIDHDVIYRGVCEVGGQKNLNDPSIQFADDYITCTSTQCFCGTDMIAPKILPENLYPND
jgi:organic radical activating enzyme